VNFFRTPFFLPRFYPSLLWRVPTQDKVIYLTFDDGPIPGPTEFVLNELNKYQARATFFCIGDNVQKHPSVFYKIQEQGHAVGNHTYHHLKGWATPLKKYIDDIEQCESLLAHPQSGHTEKLFRPPYGRITSAQIDALKKKYKIVMWDVLTHDYVKNISRKSCLTGSIKATRPGSVVVFHDSLKAERNLTYVLPLFLSHFSELGYRFASLSDRP